jgi:hypothetical protein
MFQCIGIAVGTSLIKLPPFDAAEATLRPSAAPNPLIPPSSLTPLPFLPPSSASSSSYPATSLKHGRTQASQSSASNTRRHLDTFPGHSTSPSAYAATRFCGGSRSRIVGRGQAPAPRRLRNIAVLGHPREGQRRQLLCQLILPGRQHPVSGRIAPFGQ